MMAHDPILPRSVQVILSHLPGEGDVWLVGGAIRDHLLGQDVADLDFAVSGSARKMARQVANSLGAAYFELDPGRDAGRVALKGEVVGLRSLDFAALRGPDIEADLRARDFTVNALALTLSNPPRMVDPTGGLQDLRDKVLRACGPTSIRDDPVRAIRGVRLAAQLGLHIDPQTRESLSAAASWIRTVAAERVREEVMNVLALARPGMALRVMDRLALLTPVFPELEDLRELEQPPPHESPVLDHSLTAVDRLGEILSMLRPGQEEARAENLTMGLVNLRLGRFREPLGVYLEASLAADRKVRHLLLLAALLHDIGKPACRSVDATGRIRFLQHEGIGADLVQRRAECLRLSHAEARWLRVVVAEHGRPMQLQAALPLTARSIYRYYQKVGDGGVGVVLLSLADLLALKPLPPDEAAWKARLEVARALLEAYFEAEPRVMDVRPLLRGDDIMSALGIEPGPMVGRIIEILREAQATGQISTAEEAIALSRRSYHEMLQGQSLPGIEAGEEEGR